MFLPHRVVPRHALAVPSSRALARSHELSNSKRLPRWLLQTRTRRSAATNDGDKRAAISRAIAANQQSSHNSNTAFSAAAVAGSSPEEILEADVFGMRPVDYSVLPPIRHSPPAPPTKPGMRRFYYPVVLMIFGGTVWYFYVNNKNDNYAYWEAMQTGEALQLDDDDDEYYEDEEEEEEKMEENLEQSQQLNVDNADGGGGSAVVDNTKVIQRRGWFGWLRGWKRGNGGEGNDLSGG